MQKSFLLTLSLSALLWFLPGACFAQKDTNIDSLRIAYDYSENSYERILIQIDIARAYYYRRSYDTSEFEFRKAVSMIPADSIALKAKTIDKLAHVYHKKEDMQSAINSHLVSLDLYRELNDYEEIASTTSLIGRSYYANAKYDSAMVYYLDAKEVYERNNIHNEDYGALLHFIGSVHKRQGDYSTACKYYNEEIEYGREHGYKKIEAEGMYLSGICIEAPEEALVNYKNCLNIYAELKEERMMALMYTLISSVYADLNKLDSALFYQQKCIDRYREMKEISHLAAALSHMASLQIESKEYGQAEKNLQEALKVAEKTGIKQHIRYKDIYANYFDLKYAQGSYKEAVDYQTLWYAYRDSARAQEHQDAILEMETLYNKEKSEVEKALLEKENTVALSREKLAKEEAESQSFIKNIFMFGGLLVLALGVFVFIKYRESQKQKQLIHDQKLEMQFQKELVEQKNQDITDSMIYASTIQKALITSENYFQKVFTDFFVFYQPRDIVSGDFYWGYQTADGTKMIAVGDCTGHGVPGAMMSMLGTSFLNEIVVERKNYRPDIVLNKMREQVKRALQDDNRKDGMDMSICCIKDNLLTFAGANLPIYILRKGVLTEIKGNKQPVGFMPAPESPFESKSFELQKDDQVYLFSDGYADQFGGPKGKKFKYKTFRDQLAEISKMTLATQRKIIEENFETWKGDLEQLDDVCVIGIKV